MSKNNINTELLLSSKIYFEEALDDAFEKLKVKTYPLLKNYLVSILDHFMFTENLYEKSESTGKYSQKMLSEIYLTAANASSSEKKQELLKQLGDSSLYMSGFFGDSLKKKIIDLDYYVNMGGAAYGDLSTYVSEDAYRHLFDDIAKRFVEFMDTFCVISQTAMVQSNKDLLRLYDKYLSTGSPLAKEQLAQEGLLNAQVKDKALKQ